MDETCQTGNQTDRILHASDMQQAWRVPGGCVGARVQIVLRFIYSWSRWSGRPLLGDCRNRGGLAGVARRRVAYPSHKKIEAVLYEKPKDILSGKSGTR